MELYFIRSINIKHMEYLKSWLLNNIMAGGGLVAISIIKEAFDVLANQKRKPKELLLTIPSKGL